MAVSGHAKRLAVAEMAPPHLMSDEALERELRALLAAEKRDAYRWMCDRPDCNGLPHKGFLHKHARGSQHPPAGHWTQWIITAGRGWGKTRCAAETVRQWAKVPGTRIAVLNKTASLVRSICFEHPKSGLLTVIPPEDVLRYVKGSGPGDLQIIMKNGSVIYGFGAEVPDNLRGWAFDKAWCDEYASWTKHTAQASFDMLWMCLREASSPQILISTTPKALPHIRKLVKKARRLIDAGVTDGKLRLTTGHQIENVANLSEEALEQYREDYEGTRLGDQELGGVLLEDVDGALWKQADLDWDGFRIKPGEVLPYMDRVVVAVDPAVTTGENADNTAFTVAGRSHAFDATWKDGRARGYVLHTEQGKLTPRQAMTRAIELYHLHEADEVVLEANNGGEYLSTVLEMIDPTVPWRLVNASRGKRARAAPVATLYQQERIHHVGKVKAFTDLEELMVAYVGAKDEDSPDLLDSLVWALFDLFLDPSTPGPAGTQTARDERLKRR